MENREISSDILALLSNRHIPQGMEVTLTDFEKIFARDRFETFLTNREWDYSRPNRFSCALYACDLGLSQDETYDILNPWNEKCNVVRSEDELRFTINNGFTYRQSPSGIKANQVDKFVTFTETAHTAEDVYNIAFDDMHPGRGYTYSSGKIASTLSNLRIALLSEKLENLFEWDEWYGQVSLKRYPPWRLKGDLLMSDEDYEDLLHFLSVQIKLDTSIGLLRIAVNSLARNIRVHPIKDWLQKLQWDKTPRFHKVFQDTHYEAEVMRIFTLASIARVFDPGCKWDHMLVLAGPEGVGKSTLPEIMAGKKYYQVLPFIPKDHRGLQAMEGAWWIELPEAKAVSKADLDNVKAFITTNEDKYIRLHSKEKTKAYPRTNVLVWSLNPPDTGYMNDDENRRFVIVNVKKMINLDFVRKNRDQLFAEAIELYRQGVKPYDLLKEIKDQCRRQVYNASISRQGLVDVWQDLIKEWIETTNKTSITGQKEIFIEVLGIYNSKDWTRKDQERIGKCLKTLGFQWDNLTKTYIKKPLYSETTVDSGLGFDI